MPRRELKPRLEPRLVPYSVAQPLDAPSTPLAAVNFCVIYGNKLSLIRRCRRKKLARANIIGSLASTTSTHVGTNYVYPLSRPRKCQSRAPCQRSPCRHMLVQLVDSVNSMGATRLPRIAIVAKCDQARGVRPAPDTPACTRVNCKWTVEGVPLVSDA